MHAGPVLTLTALLAVCVSPAAADTYHVSKQGDDSRSGTTQAEAFLTIARGVEALKLGDTLVVGPGVYREEVFVEKSGAKDKPITLRAQYPGRTELVGSVRVVNWTPVKGRRQVFRAMLGRPTYLVYEKDTGVEYLEVANLEMVEETAGAFLYEPDDELLYVHPTDDLGMAHHVVDACVLDHGIASLTTDPGHLHTPRRVGLVIDGFVVRDYNKYGVFIHNADYCTVRNCIVHHCRRGIFTYSAFRSRIVGCEAFACADRFNREQGNIGMMGYSFECVIENNVAHSTRQHGLRFYGGWYGCIMRGNLAYDCQIGIHVKGRRYDHTQATRYARFSDGGKPDLTPDAPMVFERNVAHRIVGTAMMPHYCVYRYNTGVKVLSGRSVERRSNIELDTGEVAAAGFADLAWHDLRLQGYSSHVGGGEGGESRGAYPYRDEVFFVAPAGSDENAGISVTAAWKTLKHAAARLRPGHTLYILPGVYHEQLVLKGLRSEGPPTTVRGHGKGDVVIDAKGSVAYALTIADCHNVLVQGLRIRAAKEAGVLVRGSSAVELGENEVFDSLSDGVRVDGTATDVRFVGNTVVFNGRAGLRIGKGATGAAIVGNIVRGNGIQLDFFSGLPTGIHCDKNDLGGGPALGRLGDRPAATLDLWKTVSGQDAQSVDLDPGFVDVEKRDLRLTATSRCRGRGYLGRPTGTGRLELGSAEDMSFTDVRVVATTATTADLAWSVRGGKATMVVAYGTEPDKLDQTIVRDTGHYYLPHHSTTLTGLEPGTRYFFRVGSRTLLDGETPYHSFRYAWPERTPQGEAEYYQTLRKRDTLTAPVVSFTTRARDVVSAMTFHVSMDGSDSSTGSVEKPFRSIARASDLAEPGDRVVVHEGTYHECIRPTRSGLPDHPIVFEAARCERVEINGRQEVIPFGVDLLDRHHITIRGFAFFGQTEVGPNRSGFGQIRAVGASDVLVERCLFDGRMNYVNPVFVYRSRDVTIHNNILVSHHSGMSVHDNGGTLTITRNSFLGVTIHKIYAPRNERVVIKNNLFGENLFPKKKLQYKVVLMSNQQIEMGCNCFYFDPKNDERRAIDIAFAGIDLATITALPEQQEKKVRQERFGVRGGLDLWQKTLGRGAHSFIADPKWENPDTIKNVRSRRRGWPSRFFPYEPLKRADLRLAEDSPCRGSGENGVDVGADYEY